jgi:hypothetical protein
VCKMLEMKEYLHLDFFLLLGNVAVRAHSKIQLSQTDY